MSDTVRPELQAILKLMEEHHYTYKLHGPGAYRDGLLAELRGMKLAYDVAMGCDGLGLVREIHEAAELTCLIKWQSILEKLSDEAPSKVYR